MTSAEYIYSSEHSESSYDPPGVISLLLFITDSIWNCATRSRYRGDGSPALIRDGVSGFIFRTGCAGFWVVCTPPFPKAPPTEEEITDEYIIRANESWPSMRLNASDDKNNTKILRATLVTTVVALHRHSSHPLHGLRLSSEQNMILYIL